ncbi:MAG TPA: glycosyltransferase [Acidimicrobiia bacterium]
MSQLREIAVPSHSFDRFTRLIGPERVGRFRAAGAALATALAGRTIWNVTLEEAATGVAELVRSLLPYVAELGISTRWLVLDADSVSRRTAGHVRQGLQGFSLDDIALEPDDIASLEAAFAPAAKELATLVHRGDLVLLHDPGPALLAPAALDTGAAVIWRCHANAGGWSESAESAWSFLRPYVEPATRFVFSHRGFAPEWVPAERRAIIPPSIDASSVKNSFLGAATITDLLTASGLLCGSPDAVPPFVPPDGAAVIRHRATSVSSEGPPPVHAPMVVQITRWDPVKDMPGVLAGFASHVGHREAHLVLAGPDIHSDAAGPLAPAVFTQCVETWERLPHDVRTRIHLVQLPGSDVEESAMLVNALQRHASVVVHKCLAGDWSAAIAEAMLKARPVVASRVGGLCDQIHDGETGLLVDPDDLPAFGAAIDQLLGNHELADRLRIRAYTDAVDRFLTDRHLLRWATLASDIA